eukprot:gene5337-6729_t
MVEDGDPTSCVERWDRVDSDALATLVASGRHLWEPDMRPSEKGESPGAGPATQTPPRTDDSARLGPPPG